MVNVKRKTKVFKNRAAQPSKTGKVKKKVLKPRLAPPRQEHVMANAICSAVDASVQAHVPSHIPMGPYTVIKSRVIIPITSNIAGQTTTLLLGAYGRASNFDQSITPTVAILGVGTDVPTITESYFQDPAVAVYDGTTFSNGFGNANLHALTFVLSCTSSATAANGIVYFGAVNQRVNRGQFPNYNSLGGALIPRREFSSKSAYSLCSHSHKVSAYPIDLTDWSTQKPLIEPSLTLGDNINLDSLSQMAIIIPPTATAVQYTVTIYTEWRVNFTDPILASTSVKRDPTSPLLWNKVIETGNKLAGSYDAMQATGAFFQRDSLQNDIQMLGNTFNTLSSAFGEKGMLGSFMRPPGGSGYRKGY